MAATAGHITVELLARVGTREPVSIGSMDIPITLNPVAAKPVVNVNVNPAPNPADVAEIIGRHSHRTAG